MTATAAVGTDDWTADLRTRRRDDTRRAILVAFNELLDEGNPLTVSVPAVAARAGVSVRTLYRYFANKDELMEAGSSSFDEAAREAIGGDVVTLDNRREYVRGLWLEFASNMASVRTQHASPVGRELRQRRLAAARAVVDAATPRTASGLPRDDLIDLVVAVTSSSMFLELVDRMGHEPAHAAELADHLIELLISDVTGAPT